MSTADFKVSQKTDAPNLCITLRDCWLHRLSCGSCGHFLQDCARMQIVAYSGQLAAAVGVAPAAGHDTLNDWSNETTGDERRTQSRPWLFVIMQKMRSISTGCNWTGRLYCISLRRQSTLLDFTPIRRPPDDNKCPSQLTAIADNDIYDSVIHSIYMYIYLHPVKHGHTVGSLHYRPTWEVHASEWCLLKLTTLVTNLTHI